MNTVQNLNAQVAQSNEIANHNSVATTVQPQTVSTVRLAPKSKRAPKPILWSVLSKSKRVFSMQLDKSNALKLRCVERFVGADAQDIERFWLNYRDQVELLLDSKRFERECASKKLNPEIVAEHIVFEGSAAVKRVIKYGLGSLGSEVELYRDAFTNGKLRVSTSFSAVAEAPEVAVVQMPEVVEQTQITGDESAA